MLLLPAPHISGLDLCQNEYIIVLSWEILGILNKFSLLRGMVFIEHSS